MIYLNVSYNDKDHAKQLGARYDPNCKKWYAPTGKEKELISQYGDENATSKRLDKMYALAKYLQPELPLKNISQGFLDGHYTYPGFAFR